MIVKSFSISVLLCLLGIWAACVLMVHLNSALSVWDAVSVLWQQNPLGIEPLSFYYATAPRVILALAVGMALGLSGSLMQQLTRNALVSPMTLGSASGSWVAMVAATIWWPALIVSHPDWVAMAGALAAVVLILGITGIRGITGLSIVLAGMALSLLLGAIASGMVMLHDQYAQSLFVWGAGDLTQMDWHWVSWFLPRFLPVFLCVPLMIRPLQLLRIGQQGAESRGLTLWPSLLLIFGVSLWLTSIAVASVGLIGFVSLLTPHVARHCGARTVLAECVLSALLGALFLAMTDVLAVWLGQWTADMIPSGAAAAFIGAPALIWLSRTRMSHSMQQDVLVIQPPVIRYGWSRLVRRVALCVIPVAGLCLGVHRTGTGWLVGLPELIWPYLWPRMLAALASGIGLAVAGVILQRLLRNPLASPDMLGISAGATLALLVVSGMTGLLVQQVGGSVACIGCLLVLGLLYILGRSRQFAPGYLALVGIALSALLDGLVQFILAKGDVNAYAVLGWLVGSTYKVQAGQSVMLCVAVVLLTVLACVFHRGLTLFSIGDPMAHGRGLHLASMRLFYLTLVALFCAVITTIVGPIIFLGLLMPHMAHRLGARTVHEQILIAAALGAVMMLLADWIGQVIIFPYQLPAGLCASIISGSYFIGLLLWQRHQQRGQ
jgi:ABC-type Fe3+-siderophore transport system permease subunit